MTFNMKLSEQLSKRICKLWKEDRYTDITIAVDGQTFKCHQLILAAASDYFDAMFSSGMKESQEGVVALKGIEGVTFRNILDFIYTSADVIQIENAEKLLKASVIFQIASLQNECEKFLVEYLTPLNAIGFWKMASEYACSGLKMKAYSCIIDNFTSICFTDEFIALDCDQLKQIINEGSLNVESEEIVSNVVLKWVSVSQSRLGVISDLFDLLKLRYTTVKFLDEVLGNPLIHQNLKCQQLVEEARCHILLKSNSTEATQNSVDRCKPRHEKVLVIIGARSRHPDPSKTVVTCYSFRQKSRFTLCSLPFEPGAGFAVTNRSSDIYLSGGYMGNDRFLIYNGTVNTWKELAPLLCGRWCHTMVLSGKNVYVLGGYTTTNDCISSIEQYDETTNQWEVAGNLQTPVASMSASVFGTKIYIFGGRVQNSSETGCIQMFDTEERQATKIGNLSCPSAFSRSIPLDDKIYIMYRDGNIFEFSEEKSSPIIIGKLDCFDHFSCVVHDNKLLVVGSANSVHRCVYFDLRTASTENIPAKLSTLLCNFHSVQIFVSRAFLSSDNS